METSKFISSRATRQSLRVKSSLLPSPSKTFRVQQKNKMKNIYNRPQVLFRKCYLTYLWNAMKMSFFLDVTFYFERQQYLISFIVKGHYWNCNQDVKNGLWFKYKIIDIEINHSYFHIQLLSFALYLTHIYT